MEFQMACSARGEIQDGMVTMGDGGDGDGFLISIEKSIVDLMLYGVRQIHGASLADILTKGS
jgi:hypothetical protein